MATQDGLLLNAGQENCRMLSTFIKLELSLRSGLIFVYLNKGLENSLILVTFIKLELVIKVWFYFCPSGVSFSKKVYSGL